MRLLGRALRGDRLPSNASNERGISKKKSVILTTWQFSLRNKPSSIGKTQNTSFHSQCIASWELIADAMLRIKDDTQSARTISSRAELEYGDKNKSIYQLFWS